MGSTAPAPTRRWPARLAIGGGLFVVAGATGGVLLLTPQAASPQPPAPVAVAVGTTFNRTELYFGASKPDGTEVSDAEFDLFVDKSVTPRFPDGLTELAGRGQFRGSSGEIVEERSFVLVLLYPVEDADADREIEEIRADYKALFDQESVLRADSADRVSF